MRRSFGWLPALAITLFWITGTAIYLAQKEQPTGRLLGSIVSEETGVAIPNANVSLRMTSSPYHSFNQKSNSDGTFEFKRIPIGSYRLNASSRAHGLRRPVHLSLKEGETPPPLQLELMPKPPFLQLRIQQHVFSTEETPRITCHGFVRQSDLDFTLYRVDSEALIAQRGNLRRVIFPRDEHGFTSQTPQLQGNPALQETKRFARPITRKDLEGIFHQRFDLPSLNPGLYLLVVRAGDLVELDWLMLTPLALITKQWGNEALAFVTDLKTGEPVSEAKVTFSLAGHQRVTGITDQNGIFKAALPPASGATEEEDLDPHRHLLALAEKDGSQAKVDQHFYSPDYDSKERVFAYTDRPVYRPGHKVRFKGVVRTLNKEDYSVPADTPLEVKVWDPRETLVYSTQLKTNDFGSYFGEFDLNEEAATGYYRLTTKIGNSPHTSSFHVAEYRKPEYTVEVTTDKERYMRGDSIQAKVSAQYYFGAPVAGADVNYTIMRSPYYAYYGDYSYEDEYYYEYEGDYDHYGGGEIVESGTAVTGADGAAQITFSTKPPPSLSTKGGELSRDYRYTIQVQVTDPSRRWVSERTSVLVTQGEFYLSVSPKRYVVSPDESSEVEVVARDHDHNPIPGQRIVVTASSRLWYAGGSQTREETRATITTDDNGKATFKFTPTGQGSYLIEARAYDKRGNKITRTGHLWVSGAYFSSEDRSYPSLEIIAEKKTYRIGETATVLINTKSKGVTALVTIEGPTLFDYRLLQLKGNSTRLEIPITEQYSPNFYICVAFVHDKEFASRQKRIRVSVERRAMDIEITPNKTRYSPGEPATYTVQTRDWQGNPVSAEISMGVVDESIYAVRKDYTPKMADFFYPQRSNRVHTSYSFPRVYLDSEKDTGAQDIKVRKKFPDTAFWNPTIVTDAEGKASVSFEIPDTLTTWRATARGITLNTEVGETTAKVLCSKDLLVRLQTPRFFVQRDHLTLSAIAHNYTKKTQDLSVWLEAPGLRSVSGGKAAKPVNFSLEPDGIRRVDWEIEIPSSGAREITVYVKAASGLSDAMALTLPALPHGRERLEWRSGAVETEKEELFTLRQDAVPNAGDLRIRVSPSLASVVLGALEYLAKYPYGCTEQTMSAFLPDVVVAGALKELKISNPKLERELPKMVQKGLNRLYRFQHDDGGWGWWRYDDSDPWMTSYVVFGLLIAKEHGFAINEHVLNRGIQWLQREEHKEKPLTSERAYLVHVLALADSNGLVDARLKQFARNAQSLDNHTLALITSSLLLKNQRSAAASTARVLWSKAEQTRTLLHWEGNNRWGRGGSVETTALAFKALYALDPKDPRLPKALHWLLLRREGNRWTSTRDTAFVIYALTDYLRESREPQPDYQATVTLNGKTVINRHFGPEDIFLPEIELSIPQKDLAKAENKIEIAKEGEGNLYYTLILRQFIDQEEIPKVITGAGISVSREYYPIVTARDPRTGVITTGPSSKPTTEFESGKPVLVRLTVTTPKEYEYIVIEDPLPAGCEVTERGGLKPWEWHWWWSDMEVRDEKVAFFSRWLHAGTHTLQYHLAPQIPGDYHVMPTQVYSMYDPDIRGSGAETRVELKP